MLWKTLEEPGTWPLPHLRKYVLQAFHFHSKMFSFVHACKALTSRCSLQILHSHTARGRLLHCVPHLVHIFYMVGEKKRSQSMKSYVFSTIAWAAAEMPSQLTFLQSSHTTELTPGEPSCSPHSKQRDIPSPHTVFFISSRRFIKRLQQHRVISYLKCGAKSPRFWWVI